MSCGRPNSAVGMSLMQRELGPNVVLIILLHCRILNFSDGVYRQFMLWSFELVFYQGGFFCMQIQHKNASNQILNFISRGKYLFWIFLIFHNSLNQCYWDLIVQAFSFLIFMHNVCPWLAWDWFEQNVLDQLRSSVHRYQSYEAGWGCILV